MFSGFVNRFLSWNAFIPVSRLTYTFYLIHPVIIYAFEYGRMQLVYSQYSTLVSRSHTPLVISVLENRDWSTVHVLWRITYRPSLQQVTNAIHKSYTFSPTFEFRNND